VVRKKFRFSKELSEVERAWEKGMGGGGKDLGTDQQDQLERVSIGKVRALRPTLKIGLAITYFSPPLCGGVFLMWSGDSKKMGSPRYIRGAKTTRDSWPGGQENSGGEVSG